MQFPQVNKRYVQYGCGLDAPGEWINYDASPTLRVQHIPLIGWLLQNRLNTRFPSNVIYGDIIRGLPEKPGSADGLYSSHTLEHLTLLDFRKALVNSFKILKPGALFRLVVPCLEQAARNYLLELEKENANASLQLLDFGIALGRQRRPKNIIQIAGDYWGNSHHLWMWDEISLRKELECAGFVGIRRCYFNDSADPMFSKVESEIRFVNAVGMECTRN